MKGMLRRALVKDESGQAMVESALVIPLMTFLILGIIQLVMIQHAKIMTEYAAFNAARAGIVWNADKIIMENAAIISLLPTYEGLFKQSDLGNPAQMLKRILQRALLWQKSKRLPQAIDLLKNGAGNLIDKMNLPNKVGDKMGSEVNKLLDKAETLADTALRKGITKALGPSGDMRMVEVEILNPTLSTFGNRGREIDFDNFSNRDPTRLTIRVRYLYMMRVPFANWVIHQAWLAGKAGQQLYGAIWNPQEGTPGETGFRSVSPVTTKTFWDPELTALQALADQNVYMVPLNATYTMRMQSNPYKQSLEVE
jgi:Flp pilus assembly pilin Flp